MNEKVQAYLEAKREEEKQLARQKEKEKQCFLISHGFFEKEYSPTGEYSEDYCEWEWDEEKQVYKWYRKIPVQVTDEEYAEILRYKANEQKNNSYENNNNNGNNKGTISLWIMLLGTLISVIIFMLLAFDWADSHFTIIHY